MNKPNAFTAPPKPVFTPAELKSMFMAHIGSMGGRRKAEKGDKKSAAYMRNPTRPTGQKESKK